MRVVLRRHRRLWIAAAVFLAVFFGLRTTGLFTPRIYRPLPDCQAVMRRGVVFSEGKAVVDRLVNVGMLGQGALVELKPFQGGLSLRAGLAEFTPSPEQSAFYRTKADMLSQEVLNGEPFRFELFVNGKRHAFVSTSP